jgi:hypothetical protein
VRALPDLRTPLAGMAVVAVLVVLALVRAAYDEPTREERRCQELRASANAVAAREDTVDDELEYLRRARAAERACNSASLVEPGEPLGKPVPRL